MHNNSPNSAADVATQKTEELAKNWKEYAGKYANASPAVKEALRLMLEARHGN